MAERNSFIIFKLLLTVFILDVYSVCLTPTFKNVNVNVTLFDPNYKFDPFKRETTAEEDAKKVLHQISGCISDKSDYWKVECVDQNVLVLQANSFENMPRLEEIKLARNNLNLILPGSMKNPLNINKVIITENNLKTLISNTFDGLSVEEINLSDNKIASISPGAFSNLPKLKQVRLNNNAIKVWDPKYFSNVPALGHLNLKNNFITTLPAHAFKGLPKMSILNLRGNQITALDPQAFVGISFFLTLDLSANRIKEFHKDLFKPMSIRQEGSTDVRSIRIRSVFSGIINLHISENNLTYLPDQMFKDLDGYNKMSLLDVHSNPWQCACYDKIVNWANKHRAHLDIDRVNIFCLDSKNSKCVFPLKNPQVCQEVNYDYVYEEYYKRFVQPTTDTFSSSLQCL